MEINEITEEKFDDLIAKNQDLILIDFWAEWCGPCGMQGEILHEKGLTLLKDFPNLQIVKINSDQAQTLCQRFLINAIPQLVLYYKEQYGLIKAGVKKIPEIKKFIKQLMLTYEKSTNRDEIKGKQPLIDENHLTVTELSASTIDAFVKKNSLALILFYNESWPPAIIQYSIIKQEGNSLLESFPDLIVACVNTQKEPELLEKWKITSEPQIVILNKEMVNFMKSGLYGMEDIEPFLQKSLKSTKGVDLRSKKSLPIVELSDAKFDDIISKNDIILILPWGPKNTESLRQMIAIQNQQDILIKAYPNLVFSPIDSVKNKKIMKKLDITTVPTIFISYKGFLGKMLTGEKDSKTIIDFIKQLITIVVNDKTKTLVKGTQPVLEEKDPCIHLEAKEFDQFLKDNKKNIVIMDFWAPWCGPCRSQGANLIKSADSLKAVFPNVLIAKINTDEDGGLSSTRFNIDAIPQLIIFSQGNYAIMTAGTKDMKEIQVFIEKFLKLNEKSKPDTGSYLNARNQASSDDEECEDEN